MNRQKGREMNAKNLHHKKQQQRQKPVKNFDKTLRKIRKLRKIHFVLEKRYNV